MRQRLATRIALALVTMLAASAAAAAETMLSGGTFVGAPGETASGSVAIVKDGGVTKLVLKADFKMSAAPDAKLAFGKDGYVKGTIFAKLAKTDGMQDYVLPASVDISKYNEVWIWCEQYNVPLASAKLM